MRRLLLLIGLVVVVSISANAQGNDRGRKIRVHGVDMTRNIEAARFGMSQASPEVLARIQKAFGEKNFFNTERKLTGTWNVVVPGDALFEALQTFNDDGTFVETSSLLGTLTEGPAHGVWEYRKRGAVLTFELFAFDGDGNHAGRIRVRAAIRLIDEDNLIADAAVDFIDLDGTVTENIATGPFYGKRLKLRGL